MTVILKINGEWHESNIEPDTPLIYLLRDELGLAGTRYGCGLEQCGACVVLADGEPVYACSAPVRGLEGKTIETVEGLVQSDGSLHPLQAAFLQENAAQCGFCTSGILMRAKALLETNAAPSRQDICAALDPHLCRCGAQPRMLRAVQRAAASLGEPA